MAVANAQTYYDTATIGVVKILFYRPLGSLNCSFYRQIIEAINFIRELRKTRLGLGDNTHHNDIQHNDAQNKDTNHSDIQHSDT